MKHFFLLLIAFTIPMVSCSASPATKVLLANADTVKIAQVKAGTLKEAHTSWWGFDKDDSTEALQNAINSGVPILIVDNMGSDWIVNKPIVLVSNQKIIFEDGVVVQAMKGKFEGKKDSLFEAQDVHDVVMEGQGNVVFRMQKADYDNPKLYAKAEWRHGIALYNCKDVTLRNLTVTKTGGDGLYLGDKQRGGYNENIWVEKMNFDDNYRQGISVISAQNLTIKDSRLANTKGTSPEAGIDFEPNSSLQRIVNCVLDNCVIENNKGGGIDISTTSFNGDSLPVTITLNNCSFSGNASSTGIFSTTTFSSDNPVDATVNVVNCTFDHKSITIRNPLEGKTHFTFKNCTFDYSGLKTEPIMLTVRPTEHLASDGNKAILGGVSFDHSTVKMSGDGNPIRISLAPIGSLQGNVQLSNSFTGSLFVDREGKTTQFDIDSYIQQIQKPLKEISAQKLATLLLDKLQVPVKSDTTKPPKSFSIRNKFTFLQYAKAGEEVTINVSVGKVYDRETNVDLISPDGKKIKTYKLEYGNPTAANEIKFTAETTGFYRVVRTQGFTQLIDIYSNNPGNGLLIDQPMQFIPNGRLYFQVPVGVKNFSIGFAPDDQTSVTLRDPSGKEVESYRFRQPQLVSGSRVDASKSEIWSVDVRGTVTIAMYEPLAPIASTNPATMLRVEP